MKKVSVMVVAALALAMTFSSCGKSGGSASLKTQTDSLNYDYGLAAGPQIKQQVMYMLGKDTAGVKSAIAAYLEGLEKGFSSDNKYNSQYAEGYRIGAMLKKNNKGGLIGDSTIAMNFGALKAGLIDGMQGKDPAKAEKARMDFEIAVRKIQAQTMLKKFGQYKADCEKFLADNKNKPNVQTTASGVQYEIIKAGTGAIPAGNDRVKVDYKGTLIDGTVFDSTRVNTPATFGLNQVVPGFAEVLKLMPVGSKWRVFIPQNLGYKDQMQGRVKPFSTLIFDLELLGIEKPATPPPAPKPVAPAPKK